MPVFEASDTVPKKTEVISVNVCIIKPFSIQLSEYVLQSKSSLSNDYTDLSSYFLFGIFKNS